MVPLMFFSAVRALGSEQGCLIGSLVPNETSDRPFLSMVLFGELK